MFYFDSDTDSNSNQNSDFNIECGYIEGVATIQKYFEDQIADPSFEIDGGDNLDLAIDVTDPPEMMQNCETLPHQFTWIESIKGFVFGRYSLFNRNKECINDELPSDGSVASGKFIHKVVPPKEDLEDKI